MSKILGKHTPLQTKNYLINGAFQFAQRGATLSNAGTGGSLVRGLDRWNFWVGATMASTVTQVTATNPIGFAMRIQRNSTVTTTTNIQMTQHIDLETVKNLAGKTMSLSWYAKAGANHSATSMKAQVYFGTAATEVNLITGGFTGATIAEKIYSLTTSSVKYTMTFTVPANALQMAVNFFSDAYVGTAGANDYYELEQVMLNEGLPAQVFQTAGANLQAELAMCQRYYWSETTSSIGTVGPGNSTTSALTTCRFPVTMRAVPTLSGSTGTYELNNGQTNFISTSVTPTQVLSSTDSGMWSITGFTGLTVTQIYQRTNAAGHTGFLTANAEL